MIPFKIVKLSSFQQKKRKSLKFHEFSFTFPFNFHSFFAYFSVFVFKKQKLSNMNAKLFLNLLKKFKSPLHHHTQTNIRCNRHRRICKKYLRLRKKNRNTTNPRKFGWISFSFSRLQYISRKFSLSAMHVPASFSPHAHGETKTRWKFDAEFSWKLYFPLNLSC